MLPIGRDPLAVKEQQQQTMKQEVPMETDQSQNKALPFGVSPVALELNRQVEQSQAVPSTSSSSVFQLPPGAVPGITTTASSSMPSVQTQQTSSIVTSVAQSYQPLPVQNSVVPQVLVLNTASCDSQPQVVPLNNNHQGQTQSSPMIVIVPGGGSTTFTAHPASENSHSAVEALLRSILGQNNNNHS